MKVKKKRQYRYVSHPKRFSFFYLFFICIEQHPCPLNGHNPLKKMKIDCRRPLSLAHKCSYIACVQSTAGQRSSRVATNVCAWFSSRFSFLFTLVLGMTHCPGHDTKLLGVDGTPLALVGIYLGEGSL